MLMRRKKTTKNQYSAKSLSVWKYLNKKNLFSNLYFNSHNLEILFKNYIIKRHVVRFFMSILFFILTLKIYNRVWKVKLFCEKLFCRQRKCLVLKCTHRRNSNYPFKKGNTFTQPYFQYTFKYSKSLPGMITLCVFQEVYVVSMLYTKVEMSLCSKISHTLSIWRCFEWYLKKKNS